MILLTLRHSLYARHDALSRFSEKICMSDNCGIDGRLIFHKRNNNPELRHKQPPVSSRVMTPQFTFHVVPSVLLSSLISTI